MYKAACKSLELGVKVEQIVPCSKKALRGVCERYAGPTVAEAHLLNLQLLLYHQQAQLISTGFGLRTPSLNLNTFTSVK